MKVKLDYFKPNGKWYYEGEYDSQCEHLFQIWEEVRAMRAIGKLPGLKENSNGYKSFHILIDVPDHPHRHPHLIVHTIDKD